MKVEVIHEVPPMPANKAAKTNSGWLGNPLTHRKSGRKSCPDQVVDGFDDPFSSGSASVRISVDALASPDSKGADPKVQSKTWLVFSSLDLEKNFRLSSVGPLCQNMHLACGFMILYSAYSMYGSIFASEIVLVEHWDTAANRAYNVCWILTLILSLAILYATRRSPTFKRSLHAESTIAVAFGIMLILRCFLGNRYRCARLFGQDPVETFGAISADTELLLKSAAAIVYLGVYTHVRFKMLLVPGICAGLSYPLSTALVGSPNGDGAINTMTLVFMISLIFVGQRRIEAASRRNFLTESENEAKIRNLELEKEQAEETHRRLAEEDLLRQQHMFASEELSAFGCPLIDFTGAEEAKTASGADNDPVTELRTPSGRPIVDDLRPNKQLVAALKGRDTNWHLIDQVVHKIRDKSYSLREFHYDCLACFPEMSLLQSETKVGQDIKPARSTLLDVGGKEPDGHLQQGPSSSFITTSQRGQPKQQEAKKTELQVSDDVLRTYGSLWAIFWFLRLDIDGKQGLCFGIDESTWELHPIPKGDSEENMDVADRLKDKVFFIMSTEEKRLNFYHNFSWDTCQDLLISSGLLIRESDGSLKASLPRVRSMLVLTAINRIFLNRSLLPRRHQADGSDGEEIQNHAAALEYVLGKFPHVLPSFSGLSPEERKVLRFSQSQKTGFHSGWLVQGEAPPSALFKAFREVIAEEGVDESDVAFYFMYWLSQLSGQEPTPKQGAEKIVSRLPDSALSAFLKAFQHVCRLASRTETEVLQGYLQSQWLQIGLGPIPEGPLGVTMMRLSLQAQKHAPKVHGVFDRLPGRDQQILCQEMARTGLAGQNYSSSNVACQHSLLVLHAPAMLQKSGGYDLAGGLQILAEILRQGRRLWPLGESDEDRGSGPQDDNAVLKMVHALEEEDEAGTSSKPARKKVSHEDKNAPPPDSGGAHTAIIKIDQIKDLLPYEMRRAGIKRNLSELEGWFLVKKSSTQAEVEKHPMGMCDTFNRSRVEYRWLVL
jgi:hypothetical protein